MAIAVQQRKLGRSGVRRLFKPLEGSGYKELGIMQDIVDRIAKLLALATSPNEHEASAAAAKASELMH